MKTKEKSSSIGIFLLISFIIVLKIMISYLPPSLNNNTKCIIITKRIGSRAGQSRSATIAIGWTMFRFKLSFNDAFCYLRSYRRVIYPNIGEESIHPFIYLSINLSINLSDFTSSYYSMIYWFLVLNIPYVTRVGVDYVDVGDVGDDDGYDK
jgi:hypothetical protein